MDKKRKIYTIVVALIVVFSTTFAILMTLERMDYRNYLRGEYSKNMYQLIDSVKNIEMDLSKANIAGTKEQRLVLCSDIARSADMANDKIHSLPISQESINGTSKFLCKVSDFSYSIIRNSYKNREIKERDYKNISELKDQAGYLLLQLNEVQGEINSGKVSWGEIRKRVSGGLYKSSSELATGKFKEIQNQVIKYPSLIYDGPFSDNVVSIKPKILSKKLVAETEVKKNIENIFGRDKIESIVKKQDVNTKIPAYDFDIKLKGRQEGEIINCEISKNGGEVIYLIDNKSVVASKMNDKNAILKGKEFLIKLGYKNMEPTYSLKHNNTITVSYVYHENNIAIYPDQIKLKIALDDGRVIGMESEKYLVSHVDARNIVKAKISMDVAMKNVSDRLKITSKKLAIIPNEMDKEVLCYEFVGKFNDDDFIVYINGEDGSEEKILQIIKTPDGDLTI